MKKLILALVLAYCPFVTASELDDIGTSIGPAVAGQQIPATIVVRLDRTTNKVEILEVGKAVPADRKLAAQLASAPFKAVTLDTALAGTAGKEELSSTSSWGFGFRRPFFGFNRPYHGYGAFRPFVNALAPSYAYAGYNYAYQPYYSYNYGNYSYAYCNPPVQTFAATCGCPPPAVDPCSCNPGIYGNAGFGYGSNPYWQWR